MGKKAWQDLACWFKNKVWVGVCVGGITVLFCFFIYFFTFLAKVGGKMHLNWYVLASLQHLGNGEASGWRHMETQAWFQSLPYRAGAERSDQETAGRKDQRQQRAVVLEPWTFLLCSKIVLVLGPSLQVPRVD